VVLTDPHDPAVKRAWQQEQGVKADKDLQMHITDKERFFTYRWDTETYIPLRLRAGRSSAADAT
jgi:hypothetical protein